MKHEHQTTAARLAGSFAGSPRLGGRFSFTCPAVRPCVCNPRMWLSGRAFSWSGQGPARQGRAGHGMAWQGRPWRTEKTQTILSWLGRLWLGLGFCSDGNKRGKARHGWAMPHREETKHPRRGEASLGEVRLCWARRGVAWCGMARIGEGTNGPQRRNETTCGQVGHGQVGHGTARRGRAGHGEGAHGAQRRTSALGAGPGSARQRAARHGVAGLGWGTNGPQRRNRTASVWLGDAGRCRAWLGRARPGNAGNGEGTNGPQRRNETTVARYGGARCGWARPGAVGRGRAR